ncbi:hypothetical protein DPMN_178541 [Dreissena polymorpha]|uniref:Uncharacterized protein n=1 Tax=Dreissena polymorpha TaxID=45954 RepID=A0A9D4EDK7_DREPO|nr:hypothetical protein DPMN_178541 [Dreissena polymorpha]
MRQRVFDRSATTTVQLSHYTPPVFIVGTAPRNQVPPPETIVCHLSGCGLLCPSWKYETGVHWGPSISKVDLQGNMPCGNRTEQVDGVSRGKLQDVLRRHPRGSANIAATFTTSAGNR